MRHYFFTSTLLTALILAPKYLPAEEIKEEKVDNVAQLIEDQTAFSISFYQAVTPKDASNLVFSPYSLSSCLSMLFIGAREDTAEEMKNVLHLHLNRTQLSQASFLLAQKLAPSKKEKNYQLNLANALWIDQQSFILSDFTHAIENSFQGKVARIDFTRPLDATTTINQWVASKTQEKIKDLLQPADLSYQTKLVLTNAVYFQGNWTRPFSEKETSSQDFYPLMGAKCSVDMMQQIGVFPYFENDLFQIAALPFESSSQAKIAYAVLLPKSSENLALIEEEMSESLDSWLTNWKPSYLAIKMPKFSAMTRLDLNETLENLGMPLAFSSQANFTGIDGKLDLSLSKVIHQAYIDVTEAGVTAAAATGAAMNVTSAPPSTPPLPFIANRPFLFFILDLNSHDILFIGKFQQPASS